MYIDIDVRILGPMVSLLVALPVLTESSSTPKANGQVPSPTPELLETTLLAAVAPARCNSSKMKIYEPYITKIQKLAF
jgi:hypothetical protein